MVHDAALHQLARLVEMVQHFHLRVDLVLDNSPSFSYTLIKINENIQWMRLMRRGILPQRY